MAGSGAAVHAERVSGGRAVCPVAILANCEVLKMSATVTTHPSHRTRHTAIIGDVSLLRAYRSRLLEELAAVERELCTLDGEVPGDRGAGPEAAAPAW
jgi:hypothetical protein